MDVSDWLRSLGLERYEVAFCENEIDEQVLPSLTHEDLKEIGIGPVGRPAMRRPPNKRPTALLRVSLTRTAPSGAKLP